MSEISKTKRAVDDLCSRLYDHRHVSAMSAEDLHAMQSTLQTLRDRCDAFIGKIDLKDPVTQAPRYGPNMVKKITDLSDSIDALIGDCNEAVSQLPPQDEAVHEDPADEMPSSVPDPSDHTHAPVDITTPPETQTQSTKSMLLSDRVAEEEKEALSQQAALIRARKNKEEQEAKEAQGCELYRLRWVTHHINTRWKSGGISEALTALASEIKRSDDEIIQNVKIREAVELVSNILDNVHKKPDDEKLRRIRSNHPVIHEKLTSHGESGLGLLISVGFLAKATYSNGTPIIDEPPIGAPPNVSEEDVPRAITAIADPGYMYTVMLEMFEPSIEPAEGSANWIRWFDGLEESKKQLQLFLDSLNMSK